MKRTPIALVAFALLALSARAHADSDARKVDAFTGIELAGMLVVEAHIGPTRVEVVGDADLIKLVSTTVKNGVLVLETPKDFHKRFKRNHELRVVVSTPVLTQVSISGTGALGVDGLDAKSFVASIPGTGSLTLAGKTEKLRLDVAGTGEVRANKLVAGSVEANVPGTVQALLHATKSLDANVSGTAVMKVRGNPPSVKKNVVGLAMIDVK
jgi:hypothetical protein